MSDVSSSAPPPGDARWLLERVEGLGNAVDALGRSLREREVPDALITLIDRVLTPGTTLVFIQRRRRDALVLMGARGTQPRRRVIVEPGHGLIGVAAERGRSIGRSELAALGGPPPNRVERLVDLAAPIRCGGNVLGVVAVGGVADTRAARAMLDTIGALGGLALLNARAVTEEREARRAAHFDALTGLRVKQSFLDELARALPMAREQGRPLSLLIFDIDHFKQYNDRHGHPAGDKVLERVGQLVRRSFRDQHDVSARYGGEEFVVLFPDTPKERAFELADRFRSEVEGYAFPHEETQPEGRLTVSGGVATFPEDAPDADALVQVADQWLYEAKRVSRNLICVADGQPGPRVMEITGQR